MKDIKSFFKLQKKTEKEPDGDTQCTSSIGELDEENEDDDDDELFNQLAPPSRIPALPSSAQNSDADDEISIEPSTTSNMSGTTTCDTGSQIPTIDELLLTKEEWMRSDVNVESSAKLSRSKEAAKKKEWDPKWLKIYPWLCPIKDGRKVIGVVCKLCRELGRQGKSSRAIEQSSGGVWVTKPFTNFGKLTEKAKKHEFGTSKEVAKHCSNPVEYRKEIVKGRRKIPETDHIKRYVTVTQESTKTTMESVLEVAESRSIASLQLNREAMLMLIAIIHRAVIRHNSPFASVKDTVLFNISQLGCAKLERIMTQDNRGISMRKIGEIIDCIGRIVLLGIYREMCAGFQNGEVIVYAGLIDNGSKVKKTKEYAGVGVKFSTVSGGMSRVINFKRCARKDGLTLCQLLLDCYEEFNETITKLKKDMGELFPVKLNPLPLLDVRNQESLAVDGALISKEKHLDQRIREHNPKVIVNWCCDHRANLVAKDTIVAARYEVLYSVNVKLFDLVNASARVNQLFKEVQAMTGDVDGEPLELGNRPMHRWESTQKFYSTVKKLALSLETFIRELLNRGWANDAKSTNIYAAHWLKEKFPTDDYMMFLAIQLDFVSEVVHFIKNTEFVDNDIAVFFELVEDTELNFRMLTTRKGECGRMMREFKEGKFVEWSGGGDEFEESKWAAMHKEVQDLFLASWKERFDDANSKLRMFLFFSMTNFREHVQCMEDVLNYGEEYVELMKETYCRPVKFTAKYEEERGNVFTSEPFGDEEELDRQCSHLARYMFRKFHGKTNNATGKLWSTKEVLLLALQSNLPWLAPCSTLHRIIKTYFSIAVETADIERLMSVFSLHDTPLNQHSTPTRVEQMVLIQKESAPWTTFDCEAVLTLWQLSKPRRLPLPPVSKSSIPQPDKDLIKSCNQIKERHQKRLNVWKAKNTKEPYEYRSESSESEAEEDGEELSENDEEREETAAAISPDQSGEEDNESSTQSREVAHVESNQQEDQHADNLAEEDVIFRIEAIDAIESEETETIDTQGDTPTEYESEYVGAKGSGKETHEKGDRHDSENSNSGSKEEENVKKPEEKIEKKVKSGKMKLNTKSTKSVEDKPGGSGLQTWLSKPTKRKVTEKSSEVQDKKTKKTKGKKFRLHQEMERKKEELATLLDSALPDLDFSGIETDMLASGLLPSDVDGLEVSNARTLKCTGFGNCLFHALSILLCGEEERYASLLRSMACDYLNENASQIAQHPALTAASKALRRSEDILFPHMIAMVTQKAVWDKCKNRDLCIVKEAQRCRKPDTYASMVVLLGLVEIIKRPVCSIYPNVNPHVRQLYHQTIVPSTVVEHKPLYILWSRSGDLNKEKGVAFQANHFVPVIV